MPAWIEAVTNAQVLVILGVLLFLLWGAVKLWKPLAAFVRFLDELIGRPDRPDKPGLLQRMEALESKVERIHAEVTPNHGGSMKDSLRRVEDGARDAREAHERDALALAEHVRASEEDRRRLWEAAEAIEEALLAVEDAAGAVEDAAGVVEDAAERVADT